MKRKLYIILFWGSVWGITEATMGYVLHLLSMTIPGLPGLLMFPIAFIYMQKVYKATETVSSIVYISGIAASIKLSDLLFRSLPSIYVINPALSLLLEGISVAIVILFVDKYTHNLGFRDCLVMGLIWRGAFLGHLWIISNISLPAGLVTSGWQVAMQFLVIESILNAILMQGYLVRSKTIRSINPNPSLAWGLFVIAIILQRIV